MPRRLAMGAYTSMVSRALSRRFCSGHASPVRMLCSRSHSLMIITRTSRLMASSILRRFSACSSSMLENWILVSLVTPSTNRATSSPKAAFRSSSVVGVSSTTSCSRAAAMLSESMPRSSTSRATASGWQIYGSPLRRHTPLWAVLARSYAFSIISIL